MGEAFSILDSILVIIPVRNEAATIAGVIQDLQALGLRHIRVIDNGSTDGSAAVATHWGAEVLYEPRAGYGQACWRGLQQVPQAMRWVLFCDGDGSDAVSDLSHFLTHIPQVDFVLGNRAATATGRAALTPTQHFGNRLATALIWLGWGYRYRDLGPLRLIRRSALEQVCMQDRGFGWTVEMQVRAIECNLRICELPVAYHPRRGGQSKISGTLRGSLQAGAVILTTLGRLYVRRLWLGKA
ncbi:MAG: glycosyltransferase family 2 protein [Cyanobacteria bacterium J06638_6]